ncbi:hypothetical protein CTheo_6852 [Ceratobasidium theobromae]|uniref:Uncharacterized protein n=1 Tax=Ceratobasidium theobromae TaxID=1582974 RepID=A0A5N5QD90_9AGAM|nr:hypothetical protein CTheo_6852 [Ceratobasidium theobromae]
MDASALLAALAKDPALLAGVAELLAKQVDASSTQPRARSISPRPRQDPTSPARETTPARQSRTRSRSSSPRRPAIESAARQRSPPPTRQREERVESSYMRGGTGWRGGRGDRTAMEKLVTRQKKSEYVCKHGHWFGRLDGRWFNPYSSDSVNEKLCARIARPRGQAGRGEFLIHEAMGLKDDYDWFLDIRCQQGSVRKAAIKHRPRNADPDSNVTWKNYSSGDRKKIYDYMYLRYPFLFHFRDESGEDCWAVRDMIQQYLTQSKSYTSKKSRERFGRGLVHT